VNNAAVGTKTVERYVQDSAQERDAAVLQINGTGPLWLIGQVLPGMIERGYSKIINIASVGGGVAVFPGFGIADGMSKAAIAYLTRHLAADLAHHPVAVYAVCPGAVDTDMLRASTLSAQTPSQPEALITGLPQHRLICPEEIAEIVWWLSTDQACVLSGAVIDASMGLGVHPGLLTELTARRGGAAPGDKDERVPPGGPAGRSFPGHRRRPLPGRGRPLSSRAEPGRIHQPRHGGKPTGLGSAGVAAARAAPGHGGRHPLRAAAWHGSATRSDRRVPVAMLACGRGPGRNTWLCSAARQRRSTSSSARCATPARRSSFPRLITRPLRPICADGFIAENRRRLRMSHVSASRRLAEQGIPHIAVGAGFSLWIDLGGWLPTRTFPAEEALWRRILRDARVNILPGKAFGCAEPGWFRLCHATDSTLASIFHAAEVPV
jgi:hypothetical protein